MVDTDEPKPLASDPNDPKNRDQPDPGEKVDSAGTDGTGDEEAQSGAGYGNHAPDASGAGKASQTDR